MSPGFSNGFVLAIAGVAGGIGVLLVQALYVRSKIKALSKAIDKERTLRLAERSGRTAAERKLRQMQGSSISKHGSSHTSASHCGTCTYTPIGRIASCFVERRGTPRQGLLAPAARAILKLDSRVVQPLAALEGLKHFSHVWLLYDFHENTNAGKLLPAQGASRKTTQVKAKVKQFRLFERSGSCSVVPHMA